jgi:hypothetical protein
MGNALVRASLKSLWVVFNGDSEDKLPKQVGKLDKLEGELDKLERELASKATAQAITDIEALRARVDKVRANALDNAIVCKLSYPRSGSSSVESMRQVRLPSGRPNGKPPILNETPVFLDHGLFKEEIQGEALLQVAVTDTDTKNPFVQFLRRVLSTAFSSLTRGLVSDISGVVANSAATVLSGEIAGKLSGSDKKRVLLVAVSEKVRLNVDAEGRLGVGNPSPDVRFEDGVLKLRLKVPQYLQITTNKYLKRGGQNGEVEIALTSEPA